MKQSLKYLGLIIMSVLLISISYYTFRYENVALLGQFTALFAVYIVVFGHRQQFTLKEIFAFGILLRVLLVPLVPNLSEDVYRFLWDGQLWWEGIDAYAFLPSELVNDSAMSVELYEKINSPHYYSIYPPINQVLFGLGALLDNTFAGIIMIRLFVLLAEIGILILLPKVLKQFQKDPKLAILYALSPLVIIELAGNLHFEVFVIFFLLWAIYEFEKESRSKSALGIGLAISFKLVPLILLASFFKKLPFKKYLKFIVVALLVAIITFVPFIFSDAFSGIWASTSLYFNSFEFNGGLYFLIREIGFQLKGYNVIATSGPALGLLSFSGMVIFNLSAPVKMKIPERMLWTYMIYLLFATTVHPWYVLPVLVLGVVSGYWFPIAWTFLVFLSYWGYTETGYDQNMLIIGLEYISLLIFIVLELIIKSRPSLKLNA